MDAVEKDKRLLADLNELIDLLLDVSVGHVPNRAQSVHYMQTRDDLIKTCGNEFIPGFLIQCVSVAKFKKFIELFHFDAEMRMQFVLAEIRPVKDLLSRKNATDWLADEF